MTRNNDNTMSGEANTVAQVGTVYGGIHLRWRPGLSAHTPHQLPVPPPFLVGRDEELAVLAETVAEARYEGDLPVLCVEGPGGIGKTALALHWAHEHADQFLDGQLYADLKGFEETGLPARPQMVLHGFLLALGVERAAIPSDVGAAAALYRSLLGGKQLLVVLDNALDTAQVTPLLPGRSPAAVIVTSRHRLAGLQQGRVVTLRLQGLAKAGSRSLLARRLGTDAVEADPSGIATMVESCAGLPLALTIVAARASMHPRFPLSMIAEELRDSSEDLDVFDAGEVPMRLETVFSWSTSILDGEEGRAFRLLGACPVVEFGWQAAADLLGLSRGHTIRLLGRLEHKSLLQQVRPGRYRMHDLLRRHAHESATALGDRDGSEAALMRLTDFYSAAADSADALLYPYRTPVAGSVPLEKVHFEDVSAALLWLELEHAQILAVQEHAQRCGWWVRLWRIVRALDTFHYRQGFLLENIRMSRLGVAAASSLEDPELLTLATRQLGRALTRARRFEEGAAHLEKALTLATCGGDSTGQAHAHHDLARLYSLAGGHATALEHSLQALHLYRATGNEVGQAHALNGVARQQVELGDHDRARRSAEQALVLHDRSGNHAGKVAAQDNMGHIEHRAGRYGEAVRFYALALRGCDADGNSYFKAEVYEHMANAYVENEQREVSVSVLKSSLALYTAQHRLADADRVLEKLSMISKEAVDVLAETNRSKKDD